MSKKTLCVVGISVFLIYCLSTLYNFICDAVNVPLDDINAAHETIRMEFGSIADDIAIHKIEAENDLMFVLYSNKYSGQFGIKVYERILPIGNIYRKRGGAYSSQDISFTRYTRDIKGHEAVVVVYGNNSNLSAKSYLLCSNGIVYRNKITDTFFLDIYFLNGENSAEPFNLILYDDEGYVIGQ